MISGEMTVAQLLEQHPELMAVLATHLPDLPRLRATLRAGGGGTSPTLADAARMAGIPAEELLTALRRGAGAGCGARPPEGAHAAPHPDEPRVYPRPLALADVPEQRRVHVDVRDDIRRGQEPFGRIMAAVKSLGEDQVLVLRAPFEPAPLYDVLGHRGFAHWAERHGPADWSVWFYRAGGETSAAGSPAAAAAGRRPGGTVRLDVRGLEPPQPMVRVLETLEGLDAGQRLEVLHDRRPMFLYPQLDQRGYVHETDEPEPGLVRIVISRRASAT